MFTPAEYVTVFGGLRHWLMEAIGFLSLCLNTILTRALMGGLWQSFWLPVLKLRIISLLCSVFLPTSAGAAFDFRGDVGFGSANKRRYQHQRGNGLTLCTNFCGKVVSEVNCLFLSLGHQKIKNYSHLGTMNWESQKTAEYLLGIRDQKRPKFLLPSRAISTQQDGQGLKTEYFLFPLHKGTLPVCPAVWYFNITAFKPEEQRVVTESTNCTVLEDFKGVYPELKASKLETI